MYIPSYLLDWNLCSHAHVNAVTAWRHLHNPCGRKENDVYHQPKRLFPLLPDHPHWLSSCSATFHQESRYVVYGSCWLEDVYVILAVGYPSRVEGARFYACK